MPEADIGLPAVARRLLRSWAALLFALAAHWAPIPASAQTTGGAAGGWTYEFTPYLWASAMKGDVRSRALPKTSIDMKFTDIVDVLDFGLMGAFEARKGSWGIYVDAIYMKVSDSATAHRTGSGPIGATLTADADATLKQTMLAAAVLYRVAEGRTPVDVFGGLRYNRIDAEADIDASLFGRTGSVSRAAARDWVDPYIGVRLQHRASDRWTLVAYADVGGFGIAADSTYQVAVSLNYDFSKSVAGKLGYRHMSVDYEKGRFAYDMTLRGLFLGIGIRF